MNENGATILTGDCREVLRTLPSGSVHCCVTSPPYFGLRSYVDHGSALKSSEIGLEPTFEAHLSALLEVFAEVWRVLRDDGTLWCNYGDAYNSQGGHTGQGKSSQRQGRANVAAQNAAKGNQVGGLKPKDLIGMPWRVAFALQEAGWYLRSAITLCKCLSGGTRVYARTQKGEMPMTIKDMVRLRPETVQLWNGERWTQCVSWQETPRPESPLEIELRSGERIGCTGNHLWPTQRGNVRADELQVGDTIRTCYLPCESWRYPKGLAEVGWFVGLYIAEGSKSDTTIQISGHIDEKDRFHRLQELAVDYHGSCRLHHLNGNSATINLYGPALEGILETYVSGNGAHYKHLNPRCWERSNEFLREVLMGYLEADGHWVEKQKQWALGFCDNDNWAADLRTLCARIGVSLRLKRCFHPCGDKKYPGYRGFIRLTPSLDSRCKQDGDVVAIGKSRARKFWDIAVEDEPHLFALASGVLTHNSNPTPESVTDRPTNATEMLFLLTKRPTYFYDQDAIREPHQRERDWPTWEERKAGGAAMRRGDPGQSGDQCHWAGVGGHPNGRNKRNWWTVASQPLKEAHFAAFSEKLVEPCILAGTSEWGCCGQCGAPWTRVIETAHREAGQGNNNGKRKGSDGAGTGAARYYETRMLKETKTTGWQPSCECEGAAVVPCVGLDPFAGSGTVSRVATRLGRRSIGIDLNPDYVAMAKERNAQLGLML